jgi:tRNA-Thr(GGU) m(6)t(6)A37 methyltransferase TsaA
MNAQQLKLFVKPIGFVINDIGSKGEPKNDWREVVSCIKFDKKYRRALEGLGEYSHIIVIYWLHQADAGSISLKVHPRGDRKKPLVGLFASRSPYRPNPVGQKVVSLLRRRGSMLYVQGLDAIDGTPVIDIKPYIPNYDSPKDAVIPKWNHEK